MQTKRIQKIIFTALLAALCCVATMVIRLPSPLGGYINLGDGIVLLSGWLLGPLYGFIASGVGSALADLLSGYALYAPATFFIKGAMALVAYAVFRLLKRRWRPLPSHLCGGVLAELLMVGGYLAFESVIYGFMPALINVPANAVQGAVGILLGVLLIRIFEKNLHQFIDNKGENGYEDRKR
ncbi:MAG: ECF transporter S component [Clostridia bacterium]|nr:ECF transporter S component [Clostridia bacterium]